MSEIGFQRKNQTYWMDSVVEAEASDGSLLSFEIESNDILGQGGNAIVFQCRENDSGNEMAIKIQMTVHDNRETRFKREIHLLQTSNHPQLMSCISSGEVMLKTRNGQPNPHCFVVMPLAERNLCDLIQKQEIDTFLPFEFLAGQFRGLSEALAVLHESAIHRDIKPENILVHGDTWILADFGLCKFLDHSESDIDITKADEKVGPIYWMSPESMNRLLGRGDEITKASDVFQLASVFWFAATRRHPTGIVSLTDWRGPRSVFEVLASALSHDPSKRPPDGKAFHEQIEDALLNA